MHHLEKRKRTVAIVILGIIIYLGLSFFIYDLIFTPQINKLTGNAVSTVNVSKGAASICNISIYTGENLISFYCMNGMFPIDYILKNLTQLNEYNSVFEYNQNDIIDPWKSYNPTLPNYTIQDLSMAKPEKGYWIIANKNTSIDLDGFANTQVSVQLYSGWNLVGYPRSVNRTPNVTFSSLNGKYDLVLQYKIETGNWYYYSPLDPLSTLTMMEKNYGYWIHLNQSAVWTYPN